MSIFRGHGNAVFTIFAFDCEGTATIFTNCCRHYIFAVSIFHDHRTIFGRCHISFWNWFCIRFWLFCHWINVGLFIVIIAHLHKVVTIFINCCTASCDRINFKISIHIYFDKCSCFLSTILIKSVHSHHRYIRVSSICEFHIVIWIYLVVHFCIFTEIFISRTNAYIPTRILNRIRHCITCHKACARIRYFVSLRINLQWSTCWFTIWTFFESYWFTIFVYFVVIISNFNCISFCTICISYRYFIRNFPFFDTYRNFTSAISQCFTSNFNTLTAFEVNYICVFHHIFVAIAIFGRYNPAHIL